MFIKQLISKINKRTMSTNSKQFELTNYIKQTSEPFGSIVGYKSGSNAGTPAGTNAVYKTATVTALSVSSSTIALSVVIKDEMKGLRSDYKELNTTIVKNHKELRTDINTIDKKN